MFTSTWVTQNGLPARSQAQGALRLLVWANFARCVAAPQNQSTIFVTSAKYNFLVSDVFILKAIVWTNLMASVMFWLTCVYYGWRGRETFKIMSNLLPDMFRGPMSHHLPDILTTWLSNLKFCQHCWDIYLTKLVSKQVWRKLWVCIVQYFLLQRWMVQNGSILANKALLSHLMMPLWSSACIC